MIRSPFLNISIIVLIVGNLLPWRGRMGQLRRHWSRLSLGILQPRIGKVTISKTNTQGKKLRIAYLPQQIASFNAGFKVRFTNLSSRVVIHEKAGSVAWMLMMRSISRLVWIQLAWEHRDKRLGSLSGGTKAASGDRTYVCFGSRCVYPRWADNGDGCRK